MKTEYNASKTRTCAVCGKEFTTSVPLKQWQYKHQIHGKLQYYCSHNCKKKALENVKSYITT